MVRRDPGRRVEVLLVDDPTPADRAGDGGRAQGSPTRRGGRARRWLWVAGAALLVLVLAVEVVEGRADRRDQAVVAAYADVPGFVGSLAEPPREVWRLPAFPPLTATDDVVVSADGSDVVGLDAATGERRWRLTREPGATRPTCLPAGTREPAPRVLCTGLRSAGVGGWQAVDVRTGARGGSAGSVLAIAPVDGGAVVVRPGDRTDLTGALLELRGGDSGGGPDEGASGSASGEPASETASRGADLGPEAVALPERWTVPLDVRGDVLAHLRVHGDRQVVALESRTTVVLDARDGRPLGRWGAASDGVTPAVARVVSHPGAGFGVWRSRFDGRWYAPDGTPGAALDGEPVEPGLDDGRTPGTVLLGAPAGDRVRAVDVASGDGLWERRTPDRVLLRLAGRLVVTVDGRLEAWDAATGEVVWSVPLDPSEVPVLGGPWTDGVRLVVRGEGDVGLHLTAYRLADGVRVWRSPLPAGSRSVTVLGDRLVAVGRSDGRTDAGAVLG